MLLLEVTLLEEACLWTKVLTLLFKPKRTLSVSSGCLARTGTHTRQQIALYAFEPVLEHNLAPYQPGR
jgi:hypothetical protein